MVLEGTRDEVWMAFNSVLEPVYTAGSLGAVLFQVLSLIAHRQTIWILESCLGLSIALSVVDYRMIYLSNKSHYKPCDYMQLWRILNLMHIFWSVYWLKMGGCSFICPSNPVTKIKHMSCGVVATWTRALTWYAQFFAFLFIVVYCKGLWLEDEFGENCCRWYFNDFFNTCGCWKFFAQMSYILRKFKLTLFSSMKWIIMSGKSELEHLVCKNKQAVEFRSRDWFSAENFQATCEWLKENKLAFVAAVSPNTYQSFLTWYSEVLELFLICCFPLLSLLKSAK